MAKSSPSFDFYYTNWIEGTDSLSDRAYRCYLRLLIYQWTHGHLPLKELVRMNICHITDVGLWHNVWEELRDKFAPIDSVEVFDWEGPDLVVLVNPKMHGLREKAVPRYLAAAERARENGKKGGRPKKPRSVPKQNPSLEGGRRKEEDLNKEKKESAPEWHGSIPAGRLRDSVEIWLAYKSERREKYVPSGLAKFVTRLVKLTEEHGEPAVIESIDQSVASGWAGWEHGLENANGNGQQQRRLRPLKRTKRLQIPVTDGSDER